MNKFLIKFLFICCVSLTLNAQNTKLQKITLQLQWKHQFEFAGFYAAKEKGFYKDVGIDVTFKEFYKSKDLTQEVLNGNAEYGLSYSSIIAEYYNGKPLVFVANFFKQSPLVLVAQKDIKTPKDLKNKKIMGLSNSIDNITLFSMLNRFNIAMQDIQNINPTFKLNAFINKKVDAISAFTTNELYYLDKKGISYNIFDPTAYGAKYYDVNLFTTQKELKNHPQRVKNFREASIKGWEYALKHKDELINIILDKYNTQHKSKAALSFEARQIEYIMLPNVYKIGSIDISRVRMILDDFIQAGFIDEKNKKNKSISSFIYQDKQQLLHLTDKEKLFLQTHKKIVLGTEKKWEPSVILSETGEITGYDADVLQLINQVSDANFQLKAGNWSEMIEEAKRREIDGLSTSVIHEERKKYLNFSDIYMKMQKMIIVSKLNPKNIHTKKDLRGKIIAVHKSNLADEKIAKKIPNSKIIYFDKLTDVINSVITGQADAIFGNASTIYTANSLGLMYIKYAGKLDETLSLSFGVRNDWPEAISIINKALKQISKHKLLELKNRWFFQKREKEKLLSEDELEYLSKKKEILMCVDKDWMPFEAYINGKYKGINADFLKLFQKNIPIPIKILETKNWEDSLNAIKKHKCDILSLVSKSKQKEKYLSFTTPYLDSNLVIIAKDDKKTVLDISLLEGETIAVVKGYPSLEILKQNYPKLKIVEFSTIEEALKKLDNNEVFAYAGNAVVNEYYFNQGNYSDFKTIAYFDKKLFFSIAIAKENKQLYMILEKVLNTLKETQKQAIIKKWNYTNYTKKFDYDLFVKIFILITIAFFFGIYRHFTIKRSNRELEIRVQQELKISKDKDQMIFHQNKLIAMGEMIENIAHQWRQPLSQVNSAVLLIDDILYQEGIINNKVEKKLLEIEDLTRYMSKTIDDFRDFFNQNKQKEQFPINQPIDKAINILKGVLKNNHIDLKLQYHSIAECFCYPNELQQVILVIVNNAIDALTTNNIKNPYILIETQILNNRFVINVYDNAGGIEISLIEKIFEPYFTTKHKMQGTGLGLYLAKMIIEESLNGTLTVKNIQNGAKFTIRLNNNDEE